jgi:Domain of unknown function DUF29
MATRLKARASDLYEQDIYAWSKAQADLLRAERFADLDLEHLIEEVADLGESLKRSVRNRVRTIIEHLLKLEYSPAQDTQAGGRATVRRQRVRLRDALTPALQPEVENTSPDCTRTRAGWRKAPCATMASTRPPRRCLRPALTVSTKLPAIGCRDAERRGERDG